MWKKRCADCADKCVKNGVWLCKECFEQKCSEIDDCPNGVTVEAIEEADAKAKKNKIDHGVAWKKDETKEKKKRERKPNETKKSIIDLLFEAVSKEYPTATITNAEKYIDFSSGDLEFTINLVQHRKKK